MTRDAEMAATDFVALVLRGIGTETDTTAVEPAAAATPAPRCTTTPTRRPGTRWRDRWESRTAQAARGGRAGSDHQLAFARAFAGAARSDEGLDLVEGLLDGTPTLPGSTSTPTCAGRC